MSTSMFTDSKAHAEVGTSQALALDKATVSDISIILDSQPSCLEFSCFNPEYFVVGTYVLEQDEKSDSDRNEILEQDESPRKPQNRSGSLILFRLQGQNLYDSDDSTFSGRGLNNVLTNSC